MARYTAQRSEQESRKIPKELLRAHAHRCPTCKRAHTIDDRAQTERLLSIGDHPLVAHFRMHAHATTQDGSLPLTERLLRYLDATPSPNVARRRALEDLILAFSDRYPVLASVIAASLLDTQSNRQIAEELGISHPTVETMLSHGQRVLRDMGSEFGLFSVQSTA